MQHERTLRNIKGLCETLGVPNYEERLAKKNADFIFDMGVYILAPKTSFETVIEFRNTIDFLLNYDTFDTAIEELKRLPPPAAASGAQRVYVLAMESAAEAEQEKKEAEERRAAIAAAQLVPTFQKVAEIMRVARLLKKEPLAQYYDRVDDLATHNPQYLNFCYVVLPENMEDGHWQKCECVGKHFNAVLFANSELEAANNLLEYINER